MINIGEERKWKMDTNNERFKVISDDGVHYGTHWFTIEYDTDGRKQVATEQSLEENTVIFPSECNEVLIMDHDTDVTIFSVDDVVHTLKECDKDWKYSGAVEHMMLFASELTGLSVDTLSNMMYPD